ncbi:hypothetical protein N7533_002742 [Penicillium manginii]|uniref:uncharacterized protein n=1 Tax=Penicillium manginii TaxID=203109 RepID=UPI002547E212|nr:uncharacterized protein N7533_002742 [Penicillium manginii]KAJ5764061.1 hypothetical protein N7533_002742 [Penicillium manginii]
MPSPGAAAIQIPSLVARVIENAEVRTLDRTEILAHHNPLHVSQSHPQERSAVPSKMYCRSRRSGTRAPFASEHTISALGMDPFTHPQ